MKKNNRGFTLLEVLLYAITLGALLAILTSILTLGIKVQVRESAGNELANQLNFSMQTIQRFIRESSAIVAKSAACDATLAVPLDQDDPEIVDGGLYRCLVLRMEGEDYDPLNPTERLPVLIWADKKDPLCTTEPCEGEIKIKEGGEIRTAFTSDSITCNYTSDPATHCLTFSKFEDYPGHKVVRINLSLTENTAPPITRSLVTSVGRASAASFDSPLIPTQNAAWDLGSQIYQWKDLFLNGNLSVGGTFTDAGNYNNTDRGYKMIGYGAPYLCSTICPAHGGMSCALRIKLLPSPVELKVCDAVTVANEVGICPCY